MEQQAKPYKHRKLLIILVTIVIGMFGFGYALVPLYKTICDVLGINGKTGGAVVYDASNTHVDKTRTVTIEFIATNNPSMRWQFYPKTKKIKVHPGAIQKIDFFAENDSGRNMTVQAIPSVTPGIAAKYLKKTECFCFTQQTLASNEAMDMPLLFHIDPSLPKNISTITLSYTLFDVSNMKLKQKKSAGKIG